MNENKLFASVALFKNLYDNNRDVYDVIAEFIKAALISSKKRSFNATELRLLLEELYEIKLIDAVIKSTLKNRLIKTGFLTLDPSGIYCVNMSELSFDNSIEEQIVVQQGHQNTIINELYLYIEIQLGQKLGILEKEEIFKTFREYILDNGFNDKYAHLISSFIIINEKDSTFKDTLNTIKEGLIIYDGIRFSSVDSINNNSWTSNLVVYLSVEHLFNAIGYNGELFYNIFEDFFSLVNDVNRNSGDKNQQKKIALRFFSEDKAEIDNFFYVAELIVQNKMTLDPSKTAMVSIVNGCKSKSDVIEKKAKFLRELDRRKILEEKSIDILEYPQYNIVDQSLLDQIQKQSIDNKKDYDEREVERFLNIFTKINVLRRGKNNNSFENIGYIFMSGKSICHFLAHNTKVKFGERDIPFSTDIDYLTNKLWFKLKKGLGSNFTSPKSLDISTKAKIILSSQLNESVAGKFHFYTERYKAGEISKEDLIEFNNVFRNKTSKPEEITVDTIDSALAFLNESDLSRYSEEKSLLKKKAQEGEIAIKELKKRDFYLLRDKKRKKKKKLSMLFWFEILTIYIMIVILLIYSTILLLESEDTKIGIAGFLLTIILLVLSFLKKFNLKRKLQKRRNTKYKSSLITILS